MTAEIAENAWMLHAVTLARRAAAMGEVPVGAIIVRDGVLIGEGFNRRETRLDATQHAEIIAIQEASRKLQAWRLTGCELYVTLEPCLMCAGAIYQARLDRVIFGATDPKAGAMGSLYSVHDDVRLNHRLPVKGGIMAAECGDVLREFFRSRRT